MKRVFPGLACIFLLLFAQQAALAHAAWHAQGGRPAKHERKDNASIQGGLCDLHGVFNTVLGGVNAHPALDVARERTDERIARCAQTAFFSDVPNPLSRGPPVPH